MSIMLLARLLCAQEHVLGLVDLVGQVRAEGHGGRDELARGSSASDSVTDSNGPRPWSRCRSCGRAPGGMAMTEALTTNGGARR